MKLLAIDTATEACSVALHLGDGAIDERFEVAGRSHTERLLPLVSGLLAAHAIKPAQLDGLVCGIGPGSFAGVRIGVGYVKGLALGAGLRVLGVSSLEMLAKRAFDAGAARVIAAIDARMNEVYLGAFERDADGLPRAVHEPWVGLPAEAPPLAGTWSAAGTGWGTYADALRQSTRAQIDTLDGAALPHAADALRLALARAVAFGDADALAPLYLRNKVALTLEEQAAKRLGS
jgi:tRNA threonylcarbamoyladenosine biosynthesis protein TsaB